MEHMGLENELSIYFHQYFFSTESKVRSVTSLTLPPSLPLMLSRVKARKGEGEEERER